MPEKYSDTLDKHISHIDEDAEKFSNYMKSISTEVENCIAQASGGIYGGLGSKLLNLWNNKCDSFENYYRLYQMYAGILSNVSENSKEFIADTTAEYGGVENGQS